MELDLKGGSGKRVQREGAPAVPARQAISVVECIGPSRIPPYPQGQECGAGGVFALSRKATAPAGMEGVGFPRVTASIPQLTSHPQSQVFIFWFLFVFLFWFLEWGATLNSAEGSLQFCTQKSFLGCSRTL